MKKIIPFLWFQKDAQEAANYYVSIFPNSKILKITYSSADTPSGKKGSVLTVDFELNGQEFLGLNGGNNFIFNESISFVVQCKDQSEIDFFWDKLSAVPESEQCGWLKDKFGVSWQIVPENIEDLIGNEKSMQILLKMKKIDIETLKQVNNITKST